MTLVAIPAAKAGHLSLRIKRPGDRQSMSRSATRALDVMEAFAEARAPLRAVDIARSLNLTPSTTNQLLKTMVESAHLLFEARSKTYLPSPRLARFSSWIAEIYGTGGKIRDLVCDVYAKTGMVVTVTTPSDLFMQIIDMAGPDPHKAERGLHVSLFGTAIGSAYLSTLDETEVRRLALRARIPESALPDILVAIEAIRKTGYADGPSTHPEIWSIALPLPANGLCVPTVLGLAGPSETIRVAIPELADILNCAVAYWFTAKQAQP